MPYYRDNLTFPTVADALESLTVDDLKKLLAHLPISEKPTRKAEIIAQILPHLQGDRLRSLWARLDQVQQAAVAEAVYSPDGQFHVGRFGAKYDQQPNWGDRDRWGYRLSPSLLGLFFYHSPNPTLPDDLRERLKEFVPRPSPPTLKPVAELPETVKMAWQEFNFQTRQTDHGVKDIPLLRRDMEPAAPQDLQTVLRLIDLGKIAVSDKTRQPSAATMRELAELLQGGDFYELPDPAVKKQSWEQEIGPIRAFAWPLLVQAANLAELAGKRLRLTKAGQKALTAPAAETLRHIWHRWFKTKLIDEFRRIEVVKGQTGKGQRGFTAVEGRRTAIARALADCPTGAWVTTNAFLRYLQAAGYDFEVHRNPWDLYITDQQYGMLGYSGQANWSLLQGRYAMCLLFEYAATLGLIDVAYLDPAGVQSDFRELWGADDLEFFSRYDGLLYFRLTPLGAYCLNKTEDYTPAVIEQPPALRLLATLEIAALGDRLNPGDALVLDSFAERLAENRWLLDQEKLMLALEKGQSLAELRALLESRSGEALPETMEQFLSDVEAQSKKLQDRGLARLIECQEPALVALIVNHPKTKRFCFAAGNRYIVVPSEHETQFRKALRQLGYNVLA